MPRKSPNTHFKPALAVWFDYYKRKTGNNYIMDAKSGNHLKQLIKKIEIKLSERQMEATETNVCNSLNGFLESISDKWLLDNLEIATVNSKFNATYAKAVRSNPFTQAERIDEIIAFRNSQRAK